MARRARPASAAPLPPALAWLAWDVDPRSLDVHRDRDWLIPRVLEFGGLAEVRWLLQTFGPEAIHTFLRDVGHPELTRRTLAFWRAYFHAGDETWARSPDWRERSSAPWID